MEETVKVALLEQKLLDLKEVVLKIDDAIEKLSEVNVNVGKILAVHEQKITQQENENDKILALIEKVQQKMDTDHNTVLNRIRAIEMRMWFGLGVVACISFIINHSAAIGHLLTPDEQPAIIEHHQQPHK
jgi:hypothetical protein